MLHGYIIVKAFWKFTRMFISFIFNTWNFIYTRTLSSILEKQTYNFLGWTFFIKTVSSFFLEADGYIIVKAFSKFTRMFISFIFNTWNFIYARTLSSTLEKQTYYFLGWTFFINSLIFFPRSLVLLETFRFLENNDWTFSLKLLFSTN